ncbi:hypothetical protein ACHMWU_28550 [Aeromicrobium sp. UC242_57]
MLLGSREGRANFVGNPEGPFFAYEGATTEPPNDGDPIDTLLTMIDQAQAAINADLFFPALVICLTLPDICAAVGSENGRATGPKTIAWLCEHGGGQPGGRSADLWISVLASASGQRAAAQSRQHSHRIRHA